MHKLAMKIAMAVMAVAGMSAAQANGVRVGIVDSGQVATEKFGSGKVHFHIENNGTDSMHVLGWATPFEDVTSNMFVVVDQNGQRARYIGPYYKRSEPTAEDYFELKPGETRAVEIDLTAYYDMRAGGTYSVSYAPRGGELLLEARQVERGGARLLARPIQTEASTLWVDAAPDAGLTAPFRGRSPQHVLPTDENLVMAAASNSFIKCSNTQQAGIAPARDSAVSYAGGANSYISTHSSATAGPRYSWWFGTSTSGNYALIGSHFTNLQSALSTQPYTFDCGCKQKRTYAFVYPDQAYTVHLCGAFWTAPNTGTDSRAGTLIHESSHFTVVAGTDDYAYGQTAAHNLALTNVAEAVMNADSHEYFAENNPPLN